jgi:hypothetical protein
VAVGASSQLARRRHEHEAAAREAVAEAVATLLAGGVPAGEGGAGYGDEYSAQRCGTLQSPCSA